METCPSVAQVVAVMEAKGHAVFRNRRGHDLNLVGIRSADTTSNAFNDWFTVFYTFPQNHWNFFAFPVTTDPGLHYRLEPLPRGARGPAGVAILKPGQYRRAWRMGRHRGRYKALVQAEPIAVYRDPNRDEELDMQEDRLDTGLFGINIHRSSEARASVRVDKWSAGCQVFQDPDHFQFLLTLCDRQVSKIGPRFSYTLLEERDF
ncbi:MAG: hypothetical protein MJE66_03125 [Proteobacteria bacterium]|nr:hypothetical protein [Pseudomonadota bacterium]